MVMKTQFVDRSDQIRYQKCIEIARRLRLDPSLVDSARAFTERAMAGDPHQLDQYRLWCRVLDRSPGEIADLLLEDTPKGQYARETMPVFGPGFTSREVAGMIRQMDGQ